MSNIIPPSIIKPLKEAFDLEERPLTTLNKAALIIVDMQLDFLPGGSLPVQGGHDIIPVINSLQHHFSLIVATQDWHPKDHKSFASNHPGKKAFEEIKWQGGQQVLWPDHCVQGSPGAELTPLLYTGRIEAIFRKGMDPEIDSYSGFFDNGRKKSTGLAGYLKERQIQKVYVCGLAADFCVYYTALDALSLGFESYIIQDASREIDSAGYQQARSHFLAQQGHIISSSDL